MLEDTLRSVKEAEAKAGQTVREAESKAEAILRTVHGPIDPHVPASILSVHPSVTILLDREAASLLPAR